MVYVAPVAMAQSFNAQDMNPLTSVFGAPQAAMSQNLERGDWHWQLSFNVSNTLHVENEGTEYLRLDAETQRTNLALHYGLNDRWDLRFDLSFIDHSQGHLDGFIDDFHTATGFPEGLRPYVPNDQFAVHYAVGGQSQTNLTRRRSGFGDVAVSAVTGLRCVNLGLKMELPTGNKEDLTGSDTTDISLWLSGSRDLVADISHYAGVAATYIAGDGLFESIREDIFYSVRYGLNWRAGARIAFKLQLDHQSRIIKNSQTRLLGHSTSLMTGGTVYFDDGYALDIGIAEDVDVETSPDVVFHFNLRKSFGHTTGRPPRSDSL